MPFGGHSYAAVFSEHIGAGGIKKIHRRRRIIMQVKNVAAGIEVAAAGWIHKARRVVRLRPRSNFGCFELPPGLVERHPCGYTRIIIEAIHYFPPFIAVHLFTLGTSHTLRAVEVAVLYPFGPLVAAGHILPYDYALAVAIRIPYGRLYLDMLANHIEAPILGLVYVVYQSLVGRRGIQAVGPPALVKRLELEQRFIVELHTHYAALVAGSGEFAHSGIAAHLVEYLAPIGKTYFKVVQRGAVGRPQLDVGRHVYHHILAIDAAA